MSARVVEVVRRVGWLHHAGGSGPYLSIAARIPAVTRREVDQAVATGALRIATGVRGCTFLVPAAEVELARAAGARCLSAPVQAVLASGEIDAATLDALVNRVDRCLEPDGADPATLRSRAGGVPALGPVGRKLGFTTALPIALRMLEGVGRAERVPAGGRLDSDAVLWRQPRPHLGPSAPEGQQDQLVAFAELFFGWAGGEGRGRGDLAAWLGCPRRAVADLAVGPGAPGESFGEGPAFVPFRDPLLALGERNGQRVAPADRGAMVLGWGKDLVPVGDADSLHHHAIWLDGAVVGVWEWADGELVPGFFGEPPEWRDAAERTARFVREELGDVFLYGRDGPPQRAARLAAVRGLRAG